MEQIPTTPDLETAVLPWFPAVVSKSTTGPASPGSAELSVPLCHRQASRVQSWEWVQLLALTELLKSRKQLQGRSNGSRLSKPAESTNWSSQASKRQAQEANDNLLDKA